MCCQVIIMLVFVCNIIDRVHSIGCFSCESVNGSNPGCEDTFQYDKDQVDFVQPCMTGRKRRIGLYPGSVCIKVSG